MRAIDVHVHPGTRGIDRDAYKYFRRNLSDLPNAEDKFAAVFKNQDVKALLIAWHASTAPEGPRITNDYAIEIATKYHDAFAGVLAALEMSENNRNERVRQAEDLLKYPIVRGFKFHPPDQGFYPSDRKFYPLWEVLASSQKPVMFHTGFTVLGANNDGGKGISLDYGRPIHLDTLASNFPRMKIIAAHPGWPWEQELIGVVTHKKNIYVDTSGYRADQLPPIFQRAICGRLQDKALFGTDFPYLDLEETLNSFEKIGLKDNIKEKIFLTNAKNLFDL